MTGVQTCALPISFPDKRKGEISISMVNHGQRIKLELADNGIGMPLMDSEIASGSLGLELMKGLCEDIDAAIRFKADHGTQITIIFEPDVLNDPDNFLTSTKRKETYA